MLPGLSILTRSTLSMAIKGVTSKESPEKGEFARVW
jgi:hypothetical protein